mmetsp:Transcript_9761/g.22200  ORF Transcript_9761/g.22200 Transcript_9761/m.22200 type:complete len:792 (+) Transcript_9761:103-2478(+)
MANRCGSNKSLCRAPAGMPIPPNNNHPGKDQHPCLICGFGCHGSGFGCCQLVDEARSTLDTSLLKRGKVKLPTDASANVICAGCYESYRLGRAKVAEEEVVVVDHAAAETAVSAKPSGGADRDSSVTIDLAKDDDDEDDDLEGLMSYFDETDDTRDTVEIPTDVVRKVLAKPDEKMSNLRKLLSDLDTSGLTVTLPSDKAKKIIEELGGDMPSFDKSAKLISGAKQSSGTRKRSVATSTATSAATTSRKKANTGFTASGFTAWLNQVPGNKAKIEKKQIVAGSNAHDEELKKSRDAQMQAMETYLDKSTSPYKRAECASVLMGIICAVESRSAQSEQRIGDVVVVEEPTTKEAAVQECENAVRSAAQTDSSRFQAAIRGLQRHVVTKNGRAAAAFLYLHPKIYAKLDSQSKLKKVAVTMGVHEQTVRTWLNMGNVKCKDNAVIWVPMVEGMTWEDVKKQFKPEWARQWDLEPNERVPAKELEPYKTHIAQTQTQVLTILSKYTEGTTTSGRMAAAKHDKSGSTIAVKADSQKSTRKDKKQGRKFHSQEMFVIDKVTERWGSGDPIGKLEIKIELSLREDCQPGFLEPDNKSCFYSSYLDPTKSQSGFTNWLNRVLDRHDWALRANSIGQAVPDNWRADSEENAADIRMKFSEAGVDVVLNMDQTFVNFYIEEKEVIAPKGVKRVGGKIKAEVKKGFTLMVIVNMLTSEIEAPFLVFDGVKLKDAKNPHRVRQDLSFISCLTSVFRLLHTSTGIGEAQPQGERLSWRFSRSTGSMEISPFSALTLFLTFFTL